MDVERLPLRVVEGAPPPVPLFGSDRRGQVVVQECRLCLKSSRLKLSHIEPRWAARWMKEEGAVLGNISAYGVVHSSQDVAKHYMLCGACEQRLGEAENYLAVLARGDVTEMRARGIELRSGPTLEGVNDKLVRRAVLGVLFKGHFAQSPPWTSLTLDEKLVTSLRGRLLSDNYNSRSHPLVGTRWLSAHIEGVNPKSFITPMWGWRTEMITLDLVMGGWSWMIFFRGWTRAVRATFIREEFNLGNAPWRVMMGDISQSRQFMNKRINGVDLGQPRDYVPRSDLCPCGLGGPFGDCCADTWCRAIDSSIRGPYTRLTPTRLAREPTEEDIKLGLPWTYTMDEHPF